ncbi:LytR family transcriptional regulator, partial [Streptomyces gardneri]
TVPRRPYASNANRDELVQPAASQLFRQLREDNPVLVTPHSEEEDDGRGDGSGGTGGGTGGDGKPDDADTPAPSSTPTFTGRNAAEGVCS